jgi:hypothetical protein
MPDRVSSRIEGLCRHCGRGIDMDADVGKTAPEPGFEARPQVGREKTHPRRQLNRDAVGCG